MFHFELNPSDPFSLKAAGRFLGGFGPASGSAGISDGHVHMAFVPQGSSEAIGVCLQSDGSTIRGELVGEMNADSTRAEVERILSLDVDGSGYPDVGTRDPAIGELQERYPGLRPVLFFSPFEAAVWAIISQRVQMAQAAKIKTRMAEQLGTVIDIHGDRRQAFPAPEELIEMDTFPGLFGRKVEYLQQLSHAALEGRLDVESLRGLPEGEALRQLRELPGVGEFSARLILLRGIGLADGTPAHEPRFLRALQLLYGTDGKPGDAEIARITEPWRPYRTWVTVLLRTMLQDMAPS